MTRVSSSKPPEKSSHLGLPPIFTLSWTKLKLWRHIGQLFARSTQGFKQSLCKLWPQGRRCAIISTTGLAASWVGCEELWSRRSFVSSDSTCTVMRLGSSLSVPPRSPKQTIQVSGMFIMRDVNMRGEESSQIHKAGIISRFAVH